MYKLFFDGHPIYDPRGANGTDKLIISDPAVTLAVNSAGSVSFSIFPDHPMAENISRLRGTLELQDDDGTIFRGRILPNDETTFYGARKYTAEGAMAYLNDSIVEPYTFPDDFENMPGYDAAADTSGNVVAWWLGWLLSKHNSTAPADRQIKLGTVTVRDPNNYIFRQNSNYSSTWETVRDKLVGTSLGGYLIMRYEDDGNYLDYLAELPQTNPQRVAFAQNLLDLVIKAAGEDVYTAILPVGADGLTLEDLPNDYLENGMAKSGKIIFSRAAEEEYGSRITRVVIWDDVTEAENLKKKAIHELEARIRMPESITVKACDLHGIDGVTPHFRVGKYVRVVSEPHGIDEPYPLLEMSPNILDPASTIINLNATKTKLTTRLRATQVAAEEGTQSVIREASKRFNELIAQASGLYCTPEPQEDGSVIYYLHDKKTLAESSLVMKLTAEAIGFSTNGGSSYPYGFTVDGELVMRLIEAGGINADWIKTGSLDLGKLKLTGTVCGLIQGHGSIPDGSPTDGIVIYGNGVDGAGKPNPPYIIVTNAGVRFQISSSESVYFSGGYAAFNAENMTVTGNIAAEGDLAVSGKRVARYVSPTNLMTLGTNETRTLVDGTQVYISEDEANFETYIRGDRIYASKDINVISDRRLKKDIEPLPEVYAQVLDGMTPVRFRYKSEPEGGAYHMGYIAQDVAKALAGAGLAPEDMAAVGVRPDDDARMTLAYGELVAMLHLKILNLEKRLEHLED